MPDGSAKDKARASTVFLQCFIASFAPVFSYCAEDIPPAAVANVMAQIANLQNETAQEQPWTSKAPSSPDCGSACGIGQLDSKIPAYTPGTRGAMRLADAKPVGGDAMSKANQTLQQYGNFSEQINRRMEENIKADPTIQPKIDAIRRRVEQQQQDSSLARQQALQNSLASLSANKTPEMGGQSPVQAGPADLGPPVDPSDEAFKNMASTLLPMTPSQIHKLKQMFAATQAAAAAPADVPPRPTATSMYVNLAPGATPPVIRLAEGFVTSLVFLDSTGAPWPLDAYDLGNPKAFNIAWDKKDNTLMVQANTLFTYGNLAVKLRGLATPVMLTLLPGQKAVDYRVDLRVQGQGPNAKPSPLGEGVPYTEDVDLLSVLDGVPPPGAQELTLVGGSGQAWLANGKLYFRTRDTVLSPAWLASLSSADGTNAYEMVSTPMILVSENGKPVHLKVEGY